MRKQIIVFFLTATMVFSLAFVSACSNIDKNFILTAKTYFNLGVPKNSKIFFEVQWYDISSKDYSANNLLDGDFVVGDDVTLSGKNVELLNGAKLSFSGMKLSDEIKNDANFYRNLLAVERDIYGNNVTPSNGAIVEPTDKDVKKAEKMLNTYTKNGNILWCDFIFSGAISDEVSVEQIRIDSLDYKFQFDTFHVIPTDMPKGQGDELGKIIDFTSGAFGIMAGSNISPMGAFFVEGKAIKNIDKIEGISIEDGCTIITRENYENKHADQFFEQKKTDYLAGDNLYIEFDYMIDGIPEEDFRKYDVAVTGVGSIFTTEDGAHYYIYGYPTILREAKYLLVHQLHDLQKI